jgi:glutathione S-transferase
MADLHLYELPPSPNNVRVRLALKFKGLDYEDHVVPFDSDRSEIVELSTQPLTPVLKHKDAVVFDSGAILRYLDANFPDTPRLFSSDRDEMKNIESWEYFSRTQLIKPVGITFEQAFAPEPDMEQVALARALLQEHTAGIEEALAGGPWLLGQRMTAADLFAAPLVALIRSPADSPVGVIKFFGQHFELGEGREKTGAWVDRALALDA